MKKLFLILAVAGALSSCEELMPDMLSQTQERPASSAHIAR